MQTFKKFLVEATVKPNFIPYGPVAARAMRHLFTPAWEDEKAPIVTVDVKKLHATQKYLNVELAQTYQEKPDKKRKLPIVVKYKGNLFITDGHHRLAFAKTARVRLVSKDD